MARHKEFNEITALEAAMHAFWSRGYEGTSLHDLESSMGLTRTSIYNAFGNKRQLFNQAVTHYHRTVLASLMEILDKAPTLQEGVRKFLNRIIDLHFREDTPGGCLVVLSVLEREQHDTETVMLLKHIVEQMQKMLQARIKQAQNAGRLPREIEARGVSTSIIATATGIMVMGKAGFTKTALRRVSDTICDLLSAADARK
ncbi:hypothetical protein MNBD_GAMMA13-1513 [hydrothermal vent metagenome]|uniref:HTH tetR-type domain-containing protein n=1 Tax=hydrothermal vent metagenome TaxID=652676 RepID=A0A3B0Z173_9ZZZZ